jgi:putative flippase GtrA
MNKIWTFKNKTTASEVPKQFIRFVAVNMISLAISAFLISFFNTDLKFSVLLSKVLVTIITLLINFIGYNFFVFKHKIRYQNEKNNAAVFSPDLQNK